MATIQLSDLSIGIKRDLATQGIELIEGYGKSSKSLLKQSGSHDMVVQSARLLASHEPTILSTQDFLKQMKALSQDLKSYSDQIEKSLKETPRLNSLVVETEKIAKNHQFN
eukprot:TRINITY_DN273_c0_g1_i1.p1 TRINITY_DN273_c0_g1~~TRINITY_DN273_c0_g1_i1.p1  ORF type:complete len:111 (-),score=15.96 TRINITY_DN273_c0_g1_i1:157-489(-)